MKRQIYSKNGQRMITGIFSVVFCILLSFIVISPSIVTAADHPKTVRGYIWDNVGNELEGASVTINIKDGETVVSTDSDTADSDGFYSVVFFSPEWDIGNTIEVIANYLSTEEINSTTADDSVVQYVNVSYSFEIPEFGSMAGFLASAGVIGIVGWAAIRKKE